MEGYKLKITKNKKGITLIELVIAISISGIIISAAYGMLNSGSIFLTKRISQSVTQNDIKTALKWLTKDLENTVPAELLEGVAPVYSIKNVKYYKIEQGKIGESKVYKIVRESEGEGKFVLIEGISEEKDSFKISDSKQNYYDVNIAIKDKWNKPVAINFKINYRKQSSIAEPNTEVKPKGDATKPFIDINNDGMMNGEDYNIIFDSNWLYDSKYDKDYLRGVLVFPSDFLAKDKVVTCIVKDGIAVKSGVRLEASDNGIINLQTRNVDIKGAELKCNGSGNKSGAINIFASGVMDMSYASLNILSNGNGYSSMTIDILGNIEGSYSKINMEEKGNAEGNLKINSNGNCNYSYSEINVLSVGNGEGNINIASSGSSNYSYSKLNAEENGRASSKVIIKAVGSLNSSYVSKQGNGYIAIGS